MSKTQLISGETLKTFGQGALGAMTFGAYHQYTTNKIMELNNEKVEIQHKYLMKPFPFGLIQYFKDNHSIDKIIL